MKTFSRVFLIFCIFGVVACGPNPNGRQFVGAGYDLYTAETARDTSNLQQYLDQLCAQAGMVVGCANSSQTNVLLVQTGFNDIDLRCDRYLGYIDRKFIEGKMFKGGLNSTQTLLTALGPALGTSDQTLRYVFAAFGFASSIYDDTNITLLAALESSTIKSLVYRRQKAFREAFRSTTARTGQVSRPTAVYALRNYLLICTPQTIVLDANTFTRDPTAGSPAEIKRGFESQFNTFAPPTSNSGAGAGTRDSPKLPTAEELFTVPGFGATQVSDFQKGSCLQSVDGQVGANTKAAVKLVEQSFPSGWNRDGKISDSEWARFDVSPCDQATRNYFEKITWGPDGTGDGGNTIVKRWALKGIISSDLKEKTLADKDVRDAIAALRSANNVSEPYLVGKEPDSQITPLLIMKVDPGAL